MQTIYITLANTNRGYFLTTYKVASTTILHNATDFSNEYTYTEKQGFKPYNSGRGYIGDPDEIYDILKNNKIKIIKRCTYQRFLTGIAEDLLGYKADDNIINNTFKELNPILKFLIDNYFYPFKEIPNTQRITHFNSIPYTYSSSHLGIKETIAQWFNIDASFNNELSEWFYCVLKANLNNILLKQHTTKFYTPLLNLVTSKIIDNYEVIDINNLNLKTNTLHSNKIFKKSVEAAAERIFKENTNTSIILKKHLDDEYKSLKELEQK